MYVGVEARGRVPFSFAFALGCEGWSKALVVAMGSELVAVVEGAMSRR